MNILEGLKRLYIVFSLLVMTVTAVVIWDSRSQCSSSAAQLRPFTGGLDPVSQAPSASMHDEELLKNLYQALRRADAAGDTEGARRLAAYISEQSASRQQGHTSPERRSGINPSAVTWDKSTAGNFWDKDELITPCPTVMKRIGATVLGAVAAGTVLLIAWLVFRWIITGFFPATGQKPPNQN